MTEAEEYELWTKFRKSGDLDTRNQLIEHFLPLVKRAAERMHYSLAGKVEVDDLYSTGLLGLMDAVSRYVPSRNIKFATFSAQRIRGAMLDSVRDLDWVPRLARTSFQTHRKAYQHLFQELSRAPSDEEMMQHLNLDEKEYTKLCREVNIASVTSIQSLGQNNEEDQQEELEIPDLKQFKENQQNDLKEVLKKVITELPEKKKAALMMYYYDELTLKEISKVLDVTEGRVSQILSQVVAQIKNKYLDDLREFMTE